MSATQNSSDAANSVCERKSRQGPSVRGGVEVLNSDGDLFHINASLRATCAVHDHPDRCSRWFLADHCPVSYRDRRSRRSTARGKGNERSIRASTHFRTKVRVHSEEQQHLQVVRGASCLWHAGLLLGPYPSRPDRRLLHIWHHRQLRAVEVYASADCGHFWSRARPCQLIDGFERMRPTASSRVADYLAAT